MAATATEGWLVLAAGVWVWEGAVVWTLLQQWLLLNCKPVAAAAAMQMLQKAAAQQQRLLRLAVMGIARQAQQQ
jgi:hypothetical protein